MALKMYGANYELRIIPINLRFGNEHNQNSYDWGDTG